MLNPQLLDGREHVVQVTTCLFTPLQHEFTLRQNLQHPPACHCFVAVAGYLQEGVALGPSPPHVISQRFADAALCCQQLPRQQLEDGWLEVALQEGCLTAAEMVICGQANTKPAANTLFH
jgi:hypothetical protein